VITSIKIWSKFTNDAAAAVVFEDEGGAFKVVMECGEQFEAKRGDGDIPVDGRTVP